MSRLQSIDRYQLQSVVGSGAAGTVYSAWDPKLCRTVAIKVLSPRFAVNRKGRERFLREARAIASLRHPNVVEIYDYSGTDSKFLYLVIEMLDGRDLFEAMVRSGPLPEPAAAAVGHELCLALDAAHEAGIIHRDLKPENVLLTTSGRVVLTDFGIVKVVRGDSAVDGYADNTEVIGTPGFMAPEVVTRRRLGPHTDVFALGVLLYNITTGRLPFDGQMPADILRATASGQYDDPRQHNPLLSDELCAVIDACLQPDPRRRPGNAGSVRLALRAILVANGVIDLRDDVREYVEDAASYKRIARQRTLKCLAQRLKLAAGGSDAEAEDATRQRLRLFHPSLEEVDDATGVVMPMPWRDDDGLSAAGRSRSWRHGSAFPEAKRAATFGVAATAALALGLLAAGRGALPGTPVDAARATVASIISAPVVIPERGPSPSPQAGRRLVRVRFGGPRAVLLVDGRRVGRVRDGHGVLLGPGRHAIEVRLGGKRIRRAIRVARADRPRILSMRE